MKYSARLHDPIFAKRDVVLEKIDKFWPQALTNCVSTNVYIDDDDHALLDSVTKIAVKRDVNDPRAATIEFHFAPNDFIHDTVLVKEFKLDPKAGPFSAQFDFASETIPQPTTIQWKSDEKNLSKRKPTIGDLKEIKEGQEDAEDEEEEDDFEPGSFFSRAARWLAASARRSSRTCTRTRCSTTRALRCTRMRTMRTRMTRRMRRTRRMMTAKLISRRKRRVPRRSRVSRP